MRETPSALCWVEVECPFPQRPNLSTNNSITKPGQGRPLTCPPLGLCPCPSQLQRWLRRSEYLSARPILLGLIGKTRRLPSTPGDPGSGDGKGSARTKSLDWVVREHRHLGPTAGACSSRMGPAPSTGPTCPGCLPRTGQGQVLPDRGSQGRVHGGGLPSPTLHLHPNGRTLTEHVPCVKTVPALPSQGQDRGAQKSFALQI